MGGTQPINIDVASCGQAVSVSYPFDKQGYQNVVFVDISPALNFDGANLLHKFSITTQEMFSMRNLPFKLCWHSLATTFAFVALAGCAALAPVTSEQSVTNRANQRWQALIGADTEKAYALMSPSYRAVTTAQAFRATFGSAVQWKTAEATKVTCEADKCTALIKIEAKPIAGRSNLPLITYFEETWISEANQWWFFPT